MILNNIGNQQIVFFIDSPVEGKNSYVSELGASKNPKGQACTQDSTAWIRSALWGSDMGGLSADCSSCISFSSMDIHGRYQCYMQFLPVLDSHPCLVGLHGTHFSFSFPVSRIASNLSSPDDDLPPVLSVLLFCWDMFALPTPNGWPALRSSTFEA